MLVSLRFSNTQAAILKNAVSAPGDRCDLHTAHPVPQQQTQHIPVQPAPPCNYTFSNITS